MPKPRICVAQDVHDYCYMKLDAETYNKQHTVSSCLLSYLQFGQSLMPLHKGYLHCV